MNGAYGSLVLKTTVYLSGVSMLASLPRKKYACWNFPGWFVIWRSMLYFTSSDVSSRPFTGATLWKRTPCRSLNTYVTSSFCCQLSARSGRILVPSWLNFRRALYVWCTTWSVVAHVSMWGSMPRMGPLRTTSVPPRLTSSLAWAHAGRGVAAAVRPATPAVPVRRKVRRDTRVDRPRSSSAMGILPVHRCSGDDCGGEDGPSEGLSQEQDRTRLRRSERAVGLGQPPRPLRSSQSSARTRGSRSRPRRPRRRPQRPVWCCHAARRRPRRLRACSPRTEEASDAHERHG